MWVRLESVHVSFLSVCLCINIYTYLINGVFFLTILFILSPIFSEQANDSLAEQEREERRKARIGSACSSTLSNPSPKKKKKSKKGKTGVKKSRPKTAK